jgi:hypothetical protein
VGVDGIGGGIHAINFSNGLSPFIPVLIRAGSHRLAIARWLRSYHFDHYSSGIDVSGEPSLPLGIVDCLWYSVGHREAFQVKK